MRVLVFHGYLLRGTGSNVYNADLAAALVELGHEVHLLCQDRRAAEFGFVGSVGDWDTGELRVTRIRDSNCTAYRPDIGGLLPVYVADRYEGLEARPFEDLTDAELQTYLDANVHAVLDVVSRADPEVALANHLVMGPAILARALASSQVPYAVKIHGSALEYTVKPHPRFLPYAREGIAPAKTVLVGSDRDAENLWATLSEPSLPSRTRLGTPGVDTKSFRAWPRTEALDRMEVLAGQIAERASVEREDDSSFSRDEAAIATALYSVLEAARTGPVVGFVGKLILSKGIDLLLAAWPLVLDEIPSASLAIVGFGAYEPAVERWIDALSSGDMDAVRELTASGAAAEGGARAPLWFLSEFFEHTERTGDLERYLTAARHMRERVILTGRLEHDELATLLPMLEALVVPSTFPESFGMVVVEAAACGALPISAEHSGLAEVSRTLAAALPKPVRELITFEIGPGAVRSIATRVLTWLKMPPELRDSAETALPQAVATRYSWLSIARDVIAAALGELDQLEAVE